MTTIRMWTAQHKDVLNTLNSDEIYTADSKHSKIYSGKGKHAYDLIINEIDSFPIWCLHSYEGATLTPDEIEFNCGISSLLPLSEDKILLEIEKHAEEVLLTDFYNWVDVLYYFQDAKGTESEDLREKGCDSLEYAKKIRNGCSVQGIVKDIKKSDIVNIYDISHCSNNRVIKLLKRHL